MMIFFTMLFNGGLIPTFLVVQDLGLLDTFLALILPNAMSAYNMFILRNYFQQLPESLEESAYIDGANPFIVLFRIILPISAPSLAAVAMFYGIANWNSYLDCLCTPTPMSCRCCKSICATCWPPQAQWIPLPAWPGRMQTG